MELIVGILAVGLAVGRIPHQLKRLPDGRKSLGVMPQCRGSGRRGLERQPEFVAIQKVRNVFQLSEAKRFTQTEGPDIAAGTSAGVNETLLA